MLPGVSAGEYLVELSPQPPDLGWLDLPALCRSGLFCPLFWSALI
jgi:hypothetical protein